MFYSVERDKLEPLPGPPSYLHGTYLGRILPGELPALAPKLSVNQKIVYDCQNCGASKFESHDGFDFIILKVPGGSPSLEPQRVCIYFRPGLLLFVCEQDELLDGLIGELLSSSPKNMELQRILYFYFDRLTTGDAGLLEDLEQDISELEDALITGQKQSCVREIIELRKRLMALKRYYEQLLSIYEGIEENENGLLDQKILRYFRMLTSRCERLFHSVLNLRDYVTQVREAYQAQVDINLNSVMKLFTVITAIFLPLSLIAGWYGMNLHMPEYGWAFGYPLVILLSVAILVVTLLIFKRKKWF